MTAFDDLKVQYSADASESAFIWEGIIEYNKTSGPMLAYPPYERFPIILKDKTQQIVGGILTKIYLNAMFVEALWISNAYRKQGLGSKLLAEAESMARAHGCVLIHLDTFDFQAYAFYLKHGYVLFGLLDEYPSKSKRYYLKKRLDQETHGARQPQV